MRKLLALMGALAVCAPAAQAQDGPQAYHGTRHAGELDPKVEPQNTPAPYDGPALQLQWRNVGREAAEPTIGVDLEGNAFFAASAFDAFGLGALAHTEIWSSNDGGLTFHDVSPKALDQQLQPTTLDPYVYVDKKTGRVFSIDLVGAGSYLAYSDDKGQTWSESAMSSPGANDHQSFSTAPPPDGFPLAATSDSFPNVIYYCVNHVSDARCARSTNGGQSFLVTGGPAFAPSDGCSGALHGHLEGSPADGVVYLPAGRCGEPRIAISEDAATTWTEVTVSDTIGTSETHTAIGVDAKGNVFYVWYDTVHKLPWMSVSTDKGRKWSQPLMIAPPGVKAVNFPEIIAGDEGRIAVIFPGTAYNDSDEEPNPDRPWNYYMVVSTNALDPDPLFVSNIANPASDPVHRGQCDGRCSGMFDFFEVTISPLDGSLWASATDTCTDEGDCNAADGSSGAANQAAGVAVRQLGGPWVVGPTPRGGVVPGTQQVPAPAGTVAPVPVAPSAAAAKVRCGKPRGKRLSCRVSLPTAPGGAKLQLSLLKRSRTVARGVAGLKAGRATVRLRGRKRLKKGSYRLAVSVAFPGAKPSKATRSLRLR